MALSGPTDGQTASASWQGPNDYRKGAFPFSAGQSLLVDSLCRLGLA